MEELSIHYKEFVEQNQAKAVVLKFIVQAIRDYANLPYSIKEQDQFDYKTAEAFLFDDSYTIQWGDYECNLKDLLDTINSEVMDHKPLDVSCARQTAINKRKEKDKKRKK